MAGSSAADLWSGTPSRATGSKATPVQRHCALTFRWTVRLPSVPDVLRHMSVCSNGGPSEAWCMQDCSCHSLAISEFQWL